MALLILRKQCQRFAVSEERSGELHPYAIALFTNTDHNLSQAKGCIDSIVPILCAHGLSVQEAVDSALATLKASKKRFDAAADSLRRSAQREPVKYKHVSEWIEGCQYYCLGNTSWR